MPKASEQAVRNQALLRLAAMDLTRFDDAIQSILRVDAEALHAAHVGYWRSADDGNKLTCEREYVAERQHWARGLSLQREQCPAYFEAIARAEIIDAADGRVDPRTHDLAGYLQQRENASLYDVPVWTNGTLVGVLCHEFSQPRRLSHEEAQFAIAVSQVIATGLSARSLSVAEQASRRASFLADLSLALAETLDERKVAQAALARSIPQLGDLGLIGVVSGSHPRWLAMHHRNAEHLPRIHEFIRGVLPGSRDAPALHLAVESGRSSLWSEMNWDPAMGKATGSQKFLRDLDVRSTMVVPLRTGGRATGAIVFGASRRRYGPVDLRFAEDIAYRVAVALQNAELYRASQQAIVERDEFVSIASHELRTPMQALSLAAEMIVSDSGARRPEASIKIVLRSVDRLGRLIDELFDAAAIASGKIQLRRAPTDLVRTAHEVLDDLRDVAARAGVTMHLSTDPTVVGDWDGPKVGRAVRNLVDNAIRFGRGRPIEIAVANAERAARITVADQGVGIDPTSLSMIFDRFHREAHANAGLGLGLYIARAIVEEHGGTIRVESKLCHGTTFQVELPRDTANESPRTYDSRRETAHPQSKTRTN